MAGQLSLGSRLVFDWMGCVNDGEMIYTKVSEFFIKIDNVEIGEEKQTYVYICHNFLKQNFE